MRCPFDFVFRAAAAAVAALAAANTLPAYRRLKLAHKFFKLAPFHCAHSHTQSAIGLGHVLVPVPGYWLLIRLPLLLIAIALRMREDGPQFRPGQARPGQARPDPVHVHVPDAARSFGKLLTLAGCTTY